jgi:hypothetical protein
LKSRKNKRRFHICCEPRRWLSFGG